MYVPTVRVRVKEQPPAIAFSVGFRKPEGFEFFPRTEAMMDTG